MGARSFYIKSMGTALVLEELNCPSKCPVVWHARFRRLLVHYTELISKRVCFGGSQTIDKIGQNLVLQSVRWEENCRSTNQEPM
jgi:hypothetical protein